jgi:hypothetical protein
MGVLIALLVSHVKDNIASVLTEMRLPVIHEDGVDEIEHAVLIAACAPTAFCMTAGSICMPSWEANEVEGAYDIRT